jgi:DNA invertase Pin-like site-specific DNA recombinase
MKTAASGITLKGFYEEKGVSGTADIEERPAFKEMIATMLANGVRTVIVERLDRLARQYSIQEQMLLYSISVFRSSEKPSRRKRLNS